MVSRAVIACLLGFSIAACDRQSGSAEQAATTPTADEVTTAAPAPENRPTGAVDRSHKGEAALPAAFQTLDGKPASLAEFKGKPVLVNLWATWCAPCVAEMPTLDAAAGRLGAATPVIAVSQDLDGAAKVKPFLAGKNFANLKIYTDPKLALSTGYGANLPTTILYGADGREIWRVTGGFDWAGAEARKLLAEAA
ncbi:TlpA family protein disulfide reductase [Sphingomonas carotinifaciens]|uniref:TlpA family protein disulfide reductase n=1 Tax=Sphingomonas carotinifaciens TaxID=1166323 RepID=UPI000DD9CD60|nr:TlpA disulfide reductase family protein [Sphingomonas carotinifaciens]